MSSFSKIIKKISSKKGDSSSSPSNFSANRFLAILFLLASLFNVCCVLLFRFRSDKLNRERFEDFRNQTVTAISSLSSNAVDFIDYKLSIALSQTTNSFDASFSYVSSNSVSSASPSSPIFENVDNIRFSFFRVDGKAFCDIGGVYYTQGDLFPRGGVIIDISPDCIILEGGYRVANSDSSFLNNQKTKGVSK